eukprot:4103151-Prymnesium_polylepis.2
MPPPVVAPPAVLVADRPARASCSGVTVTPPLFAKRRFSRWARARRLTLGLTLGQGIWRELLPLCDEARICVRARASGEAWVRVSGVVTCVGET